MTNYGLEMYLDKKSIKLIRTNVGDRYVLETILKHNLNLGGETSGHVILFDYLPTGDGILTSLFLVKIFKHMKDDFVRILEEIKLLPQVHDKINISGIKLTEDDEKRIMDIAKEVIKDNSIRIIIRRSGTEPVLRITLEGDVPKKELECFLKDIREKILNYLNI
jgi:phosphoglucosamine mutase